MRADSPVSTEAPLRIEAATPADAAAISALVLSLADRLTVHPDGAGAEAFLTGFAPAPLGQLLAASNIRTLKATRAGRLIGVATLRDGSHLLHLFVERALHGRGIGRALWEALLAGTDSPRVTCNASILSVPVYEALGFVAAGERTERNGVAFVPMQWTRST